MGKVHADIEIINPEDLGMVRRGHMDPDEVKRVHVRCQVDSGAMLLCINENLQEFLQLPVKCKKTFYQSNKEAIECDVVGPVEIRFRKINASCDAVVLPGDSQLLLGMIPLEQMDVLIDPVRQELVDPDHPRKDAYRLTVLKSHPTPSPFKLPTRPK